MAPSGAERTAMTPAPRFADTAPDTRATRPPRISTPASTPRSWRVGWETSSRARKLSLYLHVPFCDKLCWFCACHTRHTRRYDPVAAFLKLMHKEIDLVAGLLAGRGEIAAIHFGGGSPTMLTPEDLVRLDAGLRDALRFGPQTSYSVEIDPSDMDKPRLDALAAIGVNRASLGVQDFDPRVQAAINRHQSFALTKSVVDGLREARHRRREPGPRLWPPTPDG